MQIHTSRLFRKQLIYSTPNSLSSGDHKLNSPLPVRMKLIVGVIIGISVFMGTGQALKCIQCSSYSDTNCNGEVTDCPSSSDACATTLIQNRGFRWTSYFQIKSCVPMSECFNNGRVTGLYEQSMFNTSCCFNNSCNDYIPDLPILNLTLNGLLCPAYVAKDLEPCKFLNVSACTGDQTRCVRYSSTTILGSSKNSLFLGGCATESVCVTDQSSVSADGISLQIKRTCYNSASRLAYGMPVILLLLRAIIGSCLSSWWRSSRLCMFLPAEFHWWTVFGYWITPMVQW